MGNEQPPWQSEPSIISPEKERHQERQRKTIMFIENFETCLYINNSLPLNMRSSRRARSLEGNIAAHETATTQKFCLGILAFAFLK